MVSGIEVSLSDRRAELEAVLRSKEFVRSPALARLLEYLCDKLFSGHTFEIKEFSIATEVFGRDKSFGEKRDSLVRVEAHRLRRKLERFYETEGARHRIRIVIRPGTYQPDFERVFDLPEDPSPNAPPIHTPEISRIEAVPAAETTAPRKGRIFAIPAILIVAATAGMALWNGAPKRKAPLEPPAPRPAVLLPATMLPATIGDRPHPVRILAGSGTQGATDRFGAVWLGDRYFSGGLKDSLRLGNQERAVQHPFILAAPDQTPFRSFRAGTFSYRIPLPAGQYELRLYFSEVVFGTTDSGDGAENQRLFDVAMNGHPLLTFVDVFSDAGAANTAYIRVFENVSPAADGFLNLDFHPLREAAWLNAIELIPNENGYPQPIRIVARSAGYTDRKGQLWESDRYFIGGRNGSDGKVPSGTGDPDLFLGQRYGHFSYRLPVPPGKYRLRLLFAETFFGPGNRGQGGVGSRIFNVYCAGIPILRRFDIFREAGANHAIEKVFRGIEPNAQGRIDVAFEPVVNYAMVQAVELVREVR